MYRRPFTLFIIFLLIVTGSFLLGREFTSAAAFSANRSTVVEKPSYFSPAVGPGFAPIWIVESIDDVGPVGSTAANDTAVAVDSGGNPHIAYYDDVNDDLKYARWAGGSWQIEIVDSAGNVGERATLALDSNDRAHIIYIDATNGDLKYARWNGATWQFDIVDSGGGRYTSIALDGNDRPHVSYFDFGSANLKYARWDGAIWQIEIVDSAGWVGEYTSLALDSSDRPHISYVDDDLPALKYARWDGAMWQIEVVDGGGHFYTSIALDSNDRPHIGAWTESGRDLKYAHWVGAWQVEIVDSAGWVGEWPSLAVDSADRPHISYAYGDLTNDLRYARWDGASWQIETVDSQDSVGGFTSLALDSQDQPHISYYDFTNDRLKVARLGGVEATIPLSGGQLALSQQFTVTVPPNTFPEAVDLTYTALRPLIGQTDVEVTFELKAVSANDGQPVPPDPGESVDLTTRYEEEDVPPCLSEPSLELYRWFPKSVSWEVVPGSMVDPVSNTVTAVENELGIWTILGDCTQIFLPLIRE